jgi:hypothetical protein
VPQDINSDPSTKSAPVGGESPKVDKPLCPQTERTAPDPPKPSSPKSVRGSLDVGGALASPTHATSGQIPVGTSSVSEPTESPRASPPSPRSHGLGAASGSQHGEGSSAPQPEEVP